MQPNIVLIVVDQWRGDCLGSAGHPVVDTPYLDQWAAGGVRFTQAVSACPSCIAARAALMTGLGQRRHGRVGYQDGVPWRYPRMLGSCLTAAGYQSEVVGKMHAFPERNRLGFEHVQLHDGYVHFSRRKHPDLAAIDDYLPWLRAQEGRVDADYFEHGLNCNSFIVRPWDRPEHLHPTNWVVQQGLDFLRRRDPSRPFLLNLSFHRPHPPFDPPRWALDQYLARDLPLPPVGDWVDVHAAHAQPWSAEPSVGPLAPARQRLAQAGYYAHLTHIDHQINRFREGVVDANLDRPTVYCFTSDHGELLGDHNLYRKSLPYEGSAGIPLLFWGLDGMRRGTCEALAELRDIMPTLLDIAGAPIPEGLDGRSLLPCLRGQGTLERDVVHGEHTAMGQSYQWIRDGAWTYVWMSGSGHEQLFHRREDPQQLHDVAARHPAELARLRARLISCLTDSPEGYVSDGRLQPGRPVRACLPWAETGR